MRCFVIEPGGSEILNPFNPEAERPTDLIPVEIVLGLGMNATEIGFVGLQRVTGQF